jgi:isocitrate lyase
MSSQSFQEQVSSARHWCQRDRFARIRRLYPARAIAEQQGTIANDYVVAREAAEAFYTRLRQHYEAGTSITTFGPYSPGQAVAMKRAGIEGIYLGGWATSAKGSMHEDPGPDLASYPLSQVPDEAAVLVRALLTADRNQHFARSRMTQAQLQATSEVDFRPFIIADADTGHGGDAHVRNLVRRFVEVGVPGYHIEDQKPGAKKCGHQGGKVLVSCEEQIKRLNAARLQLDIMRVAGLIVARTDAESATFLENATDERDQPFVLGATNLEVPTYKTGFLAIHRKLAALGVEDAHGHMLFALSDREYDRADVWLAQAGLDPLIAETARLLATAEGDATDKLYDTLEQAYADAWQQTAGLKTYAEAVADAIAFHTSQGEDLGLSPDAWLAEMSGASHAEITHRAASHAIQVTWSAELPRTPEGYYQVRGGIDYAIAKSLAVAPYSDLIWMETKTADLDDARRFAEAMHAEYPEQMLAYNLSPSFNWDTTGMTDEQMRQFPVELGKLGFVFNFITYGGHQIDGVAGEEFATALQQDGMLALARLQRRLRLLESPYRTPQSLVGGPRLDSALMSVSGRTGSTKAMGKGSTQHQHLVQTEVPPKWLQDRVDRWSAAHGHTGRLTVSLRPRTASSELLELSMVNGDGEKVLFVVFTTAQDRAGRVILSVRDQQTHADLRRKRLMTLAQLFLIHRYKADSIHYLTPNEDNEAQAAGMERHGLFRQVNNETGLVLIATVNPDRIAALTGRDEQALTELLAG